MTKKDDHPKGISAGELAKKLSTNPDYLEVTLRRAARSAEGMKERIDAENLIIEDLTKHGLKVSSLASLAGSSMEYRNAAPVLLHWLPLTKNLDIKEAIVRALSVPWAKELAAFPLIQELRRFRTDPGATALKWAICNALEVFADSSLLVELVDIVQDKQLGTARQMAVLALGKIRHPLSIETLIRLLDDEEVVGHALISLGELQAVDATEEIEKLLQHKRKWIRQEARKAIHKIGRRHGSDRNHT